MSAMASQTTGAPIVCSTVGSGADHRNHQSSAPLAFVWGTHRWPVNSPQKGTVTRNLFPYDDVIMIVCDGAWCVGMLHNPTHIPPRKLLWLHFLQEENYSVCSSQVSPDGKQVIQFVAGNNCRQAMEKDMFTYIKYMGNVDFNMYSVLYFTCNASISYVNQDVGLRF